MSQILRFLLAGLLAALTGCGAGDPAAGAAPAVEVPSIASSTSEANAEAPAAGCAGDLPASAPPVEVAARLVGGRAEPSPTRVDVALGSPVVLRVEADAPAEIHVHGYDRAADVAPGAPACIDLVADVPGVFEVESHPDHTLLLQLAVR
jgi:hypothetical protein